MECSSFNLDYSRSIKVKILFLTLGNELVASSRTRVYQYLRFIKKANISYKIIKYESGLDYLFISNYKVQNKPSKIIYWCFIKSIEQFHKVYSSVQITRLIFQCIFADVLFIQKVTLPIWIQTLLKTLQPKIIFDFDDAIYSDVLNYNKKRIDHQLSLTSLAILENEETEKYAKKFEIKSLRITGPIDCDRYLPSNHFISGGTTIGWIGSSSTTQYLRLIEKPLQIISKTHPNINLELIGAKNFEVEGVNIIGNKWSLKSEVELLSHFDIGIMPLIDNEWSRGKGGYKILQYMAMGIPSVVSPVGINKELIIDGENGFLASDSKEWVEKLNYLIENPNIRLRMGESARKIAIAKYSFSAYFPIFEKHLSDLINEK